MGGQARTGRLVQDQSATKKDNGGGVGGHRRVAPKLTVLTHAQLRWGRGGVGCWTGRCATAAPLEDESGA